MTPVVALGHLRVAVGWAEGAAERARIPTVLGGAAGGGVTRASEHLWWVELLSRRHGRLVPGGFSFSLFGCWCHAVAHGADAVCLSIAGSLVRLSARVCWRDVVPGICLWPSPMACPSSLFVGVAEGGAHCSSSPRQARSRWQARVFPCAPFGCRCHGLVATASSGGCDQPLLAARQQRWVLGKS